jgi:hypothetical protein
MRGHSINIWQRGRHETHRPTDQEEETCSKLSHRLAHFAIVGIKVKDVPYDIPKTLRNNEV